MRVKVDYGLPRTMSDVIRNSRPAGAIGAPRIFHPLVAEHAFPLSVVRRRLMDMHYQTNRHLLMLLAFEPSQERNHWKSELNALLGEVVRTRLTKGNKPVPAKLYREFFWKGPFAGHAEETIGSMLQDLLDEKPSQRRIAKDLTALAREIEEWHTNVGAAIEARQSVRPLVDAL